MSNNKKKKSKKETIKVEDLKKQVDALNDRVNKLETELRSAEVLIEKIVRVMELVHKTTDAQATYLQKLNGD